MLEFLTSNQMTLISIIVMIILAVIGWTFFSQRSGKSITQNQKGNGIQSGRDTKINLKDRR